jgi:Ca-activated chloride channel homolog
VYHFRFAYPLVLYIGIPLWIIFIIFKLKFHRIPLYSYPMVSLMYDKDCVISSFHKYVLFFLRALSLLFLVLLMARPQWVDSRSVTNVDGVDIMLTLDVSGSMQFFDDISDKRMRIDVEKKEASRFIEKRTDDQIGITIFAADAIALCPLTLDKTILQSIVREIHLGFINQQATALATGLSLALTKLRQSKAKSKIVILLTDGKPTPEVEKVPLETAIDIAKKLNIKVYTIGIGNKDGGYFQNPWGEVVMIKDSVDEDLLQRIADETGGKFFRAYNPKAMASAYDEIDKLEKTKIESNLFSRAYEAVGIFIFVILFLLFFEIFLRLFVWRGIV